MKMDYSIERKKLVASEIVSQAINLYKENFWLLFKLNGIGVLITFITSNIVRLSNFIDSMAIRMLVQLIGVAISYVGIYYSLRISVALVLTIRDRYFNQEAGIKSNYLKGKKHIWRYIGTILLIGLMLVVPVMIASFGFTSIKTLPLKIVVMLLGGIPFVYILVVYGFAVYVRIFRAEIKNNFAYSKSLVKGHFVEVLLISIVPIVLNVPNYVSQFFIDKRGLGAMARFLYDNVGVFVSLFTAPLVVGIFVITYLNLDNK